MESSWFKKLAVTPQVLTTYRVGLVQAKAYRILNARTAELLEPHGIRPLDWALLGALHDKNDELLAGEIADLLGVQPPHVTSMITRLKKKGLISTYICPDDRRQKCVELTPGGKAFMPKVEKELRAQMRALTGSLHTKDVLAYVHVLNAIVKNGDEN